MRSGRGKIGPREAAAIAGDHDLGRSAQNSNGRNIPAVHDHRHKHYSQSQSLKPSVVNVYSKSISCVLSHCHLLLMY